MPAYNFQRRFVPKILDLSKPHTIRRRRKYPTKVGDMLQLYVGLRTKAAFKFAEVPCAKIEPVLIYPKLKQLEIMTGCNAYSPLAMSALHDIARRDGFDSIANFFYFFEHTYKDDVLEDFEIVWWDTEKLKGFTIHFSPENIDGKIKGVASKNFLIVVVDDAVEVRGV